MGSRTQAGGPAGRDRRRAAAWAGIAPPLVLLVLLAGAPAPLLAQADAGIAISTPAGDDEPLELDAQTMTPSVTGWLYRFPVRVTASRPILGAEVNGESRDVPHDTEVRFQAPVVLHAGDNRITVTAFTEQGEARRTFRVNLHAAEGPRNRTGHGFTDANILIFRPVGVREREVDPNALLRVPGGGAYLFEPGERPPVGAGLMYRFEVEVSAFSPIRWVAVDGSVVARPDSTWTRAVRLIPLTPELSEVTVEAATDWGTARRVFELRLDATQLPGTPFYLKQPDGGSANGDD